MKEIKNKCKTFSIISRSILHRLIVLIVMVFATITIFAQSGGANPGGDPTGFETPLDGGLLMALLAGGGIASMLLKKKKNKE